LILNTETFYFKADILEAKKNEGYDAFEWHYVNIIRKAHILTIAAHLAGLITLNLRGN